MQNPDPTINLFSQRVENSGLKSSSSKQGTRHTSKHDSNASCIETRSARVKPKNGTQPADDETNLKQADNPLSVEVDVYVIEPRAGREARDGVDVAAQEVHEAGPHGRSHVSDEDLTRKNNRTDVHEEVHTHHTLEERGLEM